jgi:hypothetical protein
MPTDPSTRRSPSPSDHVGERVLESLGDVVDRRAIPDRRLLTPAADAQEDAAQTGNGLARRRGPGRRLSDFQRSAEEGQLTPEQFLFVMAIDEFKKANNKTFPSWTDVLEVIRLLGYRKTCPSELNLTRAEDWRESAETPSNVRPPRWAERFTGRERRDVA